MAEVVPLERYRAQRPPGRGWATATFSFDVGSPATYLAVERVDRFFEGIRWRPVLGPGLAERGLDRLAVERRARELRLPLHWPERPAAAVGASRVADLAVVRGRGAAFVLAASRLAFCGGFDLDDPRVLLEAAAAAGLAPHEARAVARDPSRDAELEAQRRRLDDLGATALPVLRVGRAVFCGEERLDEALLALRLRGHRARATRRTG